MTRLSKFFLAVLLLTVASVSWAEESIDQWGKSHYDTYGRAEGRTLTASGNYGDYVRKYADLLAGYNASVGGSTSGSSCYGDYVRTYGDLLAAYNASGGGQSIETWGKSHYNAWGQVEGRSACVPTGDYRYLYDHNANLLGGRTRRWKSTTIQVSGAVGGKRLIAGQWSQTSISFMSIQLRRMVWGLKSLGIPTLQVTSAVRQVLVIGRRPENWQIAQ